VLGEKLLNPITTMSTDRIEYQDGVVSNCCGASIYSDTDICSDCKEHCSEVCEVCNGTGIVEIMGDGPNFEWDVIGTRPCACVKENND
jgi:hypothetical protein